MGAVIPKLVIQEEDGNPSGQPSTLKVSNGTLTDNGDGSFSLVTGGGSPVLSVETPSGDIDDSNVTFTVANPPAFLVLNGAIQTEGVDYTLSSLTITMLYAPPTGSVFRSYYF